MNATMQNEIFPLKIVFWETTVRCNLHCGHCRRISEQSINELTTKEAKIFINNLADFSQHQHQPIILIFSGGEPLLRDDIFELAKYASEHKLITALASNGTLIDDNAAEKIAKAGFARVAISLDSPIADIHDKARNQKGSFDAAVKGIKLLKQKQIAVQINSTISRNTVDYSDKMLTLAESLGVCAWHIFLFVPVGCGAELPDEQILSPTEAENFLHKIYGYSQRTNIQIKPTCVPQYYRILAQHHQLKAGNTWYRYTRGCLAGINVCFISAIGKVFPCGYFPMEAGDIRKSSIIEIWQNSSLFAKLRDLSNIKGKCGRCEYLNICGGCRARAYAKTGDFLEQDPSCIYHC